MFRLKIETLGNRNETVTIPDGDLVRWHRDGEKIEVLIDAVDLVTVAHRLAEQFRMAPIEIEIECHRPVRFGGREDMVEDLQARLEEHIAQSLAADSAIRTITAKVMLDGLRESMRSALHEHNAEILDHAQRMSHGVNSEHEKIEHRIKGLDPSQAQRWCLHLLEDPASSLHPFLGAGLVVQARRVLGTPASGANEIERELTATQCFEAAYEHEHGAQRLAGAEQAAERVRARAFAVAGWAARVEPWKATRAVLQGQDSNATPEHLLKDLETIAPEQSEDDQ